jgi:signal transduction histidine kinase
LRTPLTAVLGQIEVTLERDRTASEYQGALRRIARPTRRLVQIVEMLLFLARPDAEADLRELETADLGVWLRGHVEHWPGRERAADVVVEAPKDPLPVRIQPVLLGQALDNLLDNASKYSRPATPIRLRVSRADGRAVLEVEDEGIGISPDDLDQVFEPFFRGAEARRLGIDGLGLGLALVQRIARAHHGAVGARSHPPHGTTFRLELPISSAVPA